jgi:hypothetical protein
MACANAGQRAGLPANSGGEAAWKETYRMSIESDSQTSSNVTRDSKSDMPVFDGFSTRDVSDIALQRTDTLARFPRFGAVSFRAWRNGIAAPLLAESLLRRKTILSGAWDAA